MQSEYEDQLPASVQALLDEIEAALGGELLVQRVPDLPAEMAVVFGSKERFKFKVPEDNLLPVLHYRTDLAATGPLCDLPFAVLCHELLHLRRYLVDRVPAVYLIRGVPQTDPDLTRPPISVEGIENLLEHIVIEPRVCNYIPGYRLRHCRREIWDSIPPKPWGVSEHEVHWHVMYEWLNVNFLNENEDEEIKEYAAKTIQRLGWWDEARVAAHLMTQALQFAENPRLLVEAKEGMALVACLAFRIPVDAMGLLYGLKHLKMLPEIFEGGLLDRLDLRMPPELCSGGKETKS